MSSPPPRAEHRPQKRQRTASPSANGAADSPDTPYLHTVDRTVLDFDLPWLCSVTLKSHNVYVCLLCGRFFHGRSPSTPAYVHALHDSHHLFQNLSDGVVHTLPDDIVVHHAALADLPATLHPTFTAPQLAQLDRDAFQVRLVDGSTRLRGAVALDHLHNSAFANVVLQLVLRPPVLRDALLLHSPSTHGLQQQPRLNVALHDALAELCRKLWASHAFRPLVAPHTLMHLVDREFEKKRSSVGPDGPAAAHKDPVMFCAWLLNSVTGGKRAVREKSAAVDVFSRLVRQTFKGEMDVLTFSKDGDAKKTTSKFWFLSLDLPPKPLFKHESEREIVMQVSLEKLLAKFDGVSRHHVVETGETRSYKVTSLPPFLLLVLRRFTKSNFAMEKNPCVVHLPPGRLDLSAIEQSGHRYRLLGAVSHKGSLEKGDYRVSIFHEATKSWYEMTGTGVEPTLFQLVSLTDTYILLYERVEDALPSA